MEVTTLWESVSRLLGYIGYRVRILQSWMCCCLSPTLEILGSLVPGPFRSEDLEPMKGSCLGSPSLGSTTKSISSWVELKVKILCGGREASLERTLAGKKVHWTPGGISSRLHKPALHTYSGHLLHIPALDTWSTYLFQSPAPDTCSAHLLQTPAMHTCSAWVCFLVWKVLLSVCCFYWLINKELTWPITREEEGGVRETPWSHCQR